MYGIYTQDANERLHTFRTPCVTSRSVALRALDHKRIGSSNGHGYDRTVPYKGTLSTDLLCRTRGLSRT
eukprot:7586558-Pyramimonas_sp.AAC.1